MLEKYTRTCMSVRAISKLQEVTLAAAMSLHLLGLGTHSHLNTHVYSLPDQTLYVVCRQMSRVLSHYSAQLQSLGGSIITCSIPQRRQVLRC